MKSKRSDEENAFREGLQDNTVKLSDDQEDPKSRVTNQDQQVTNEEEQNIVTVEVDGYDVENDTEEQTPDKDQKKPGTDVSEEDDRDEQPGRKEHEK
jgi:hypothetical protein